MGCAAEQSPQRDSEQLTPKDGGSQSVHFEAGGQTVHFEAGSQTVHFEAGDQGIRLDAASEPVRWDAGSDAGQAAREAASQDLDAQLQSLICADGLCVAVGTAGDSWNEEQQSLHTSWIISSEDGLNWTERFIGAHGFLRSVAHSNGRWVAVGDTFGIAADSPVFVSDDGLTWTFVSVPDFSAPLQVIAAGDGFLLNDGGDSLWFSEDGEHWVARNTPFWMGHMAAWGPGVFSAYGYRVHLTTDLGETWSEEGLPKPEGHPFSDIDLERLWAAGDELHAMGIVVPLHDEDTLYYSVRRDLAGAWQIDHVSAEPFIPQVVVEGDGVSVASDGRHLAYRELGSRTWTAVPRGSEDRAQFAELAYFSGVFVAAGAWGLRYSEDGKVWKRYESLASD
jgi:hypothetical protein